MPISSIQGITFFAASGATAFATFGSMPTAGNTIILGESHETPGTITSIVQANVTWTKDREFAPGNGLSASIWRAFPIAASAGTLVTITYSGVVGHPNFTAFEYSGLTGLLDKTASNSGSSATIDNGTTAVTSQAEELWFSKDIKTPDSATLTYPSGWAVQEENSDLTHAVHIFTQLTSNTGVAEVNYTVGSVSTWSGVTATYPAFIPPVCRTPLTTVQNYITELRDRFAEINFTTWLPDSDLIAWLNLGLDDIVFRTLPARYEVYPPYTIASVAGQYRYPLPADFFRVKQFGDSGGVFFNGSPLYNEDQTDSLEDDLSSISPTPNESDPNSYWIWSKQIFVYPIPGPDSFPIKMYYYRLPIDTCALTDVVDLDRPYTEVLIKFILWKALEKDKHPMAQYYRQEYEGALSNMYSESRIKVEKRARYVHTHDYYGRDGR
jgi:hypothetical protein